MSTSPFCTADSRSAKSIGTRVSFTPIALAIALAISMSKPISDPSFAVALSGGWVPEVPTRSSPLCTIRSMTGDGDDADDVPDMAAQPVSAAPASRPAIRDQRFMIILLRRAPRIVRRAPTSPLRVRHPRAPRVRRSYQTPHRRQDSSRWLTRRITLATLGAHG